MFNPKAWAFILGTMLLVTAGAMLLPVACSLLYGEDDLVALLISMGVAIAVGLPLRLGFRRSQTVTSRDALVIATLGWVVISLVSALPFVLHGSIPHFADAFFEMMSGYTTTGATVLTDIEAVPHGLLMWRSETHLLGGMGFITLAVVFLPHGVLGLRLFRAESSPGQGITGERFTARNRDAMGFLWAIYLALNAAQIVLLWIGGMSLFDSLCHAFGTVSTSGYSTYNASMGAFDSAWFDWVTVVFMFLGGVSFVLFYQLFAGNFRRLRIDTELRWYIGFTLAFCLAVAGILYSGGVYGFADSLRHGSFQVVSLLTTTGFTTVDYETWPNSAQMLLYVVCFIGACAVSTTSGIKVVHYVIILKFLSAAVKKLFFQPLAVVSVRLNNQRMEASAIHLALAYLIANLFIIGFGAVVITLTDDLDVESAISAVIATLMNIGPGFGDVGPSHNYAFFSPAGKTFLSVLMLVGRLEMFSALALLYPSFWRQ